MKYHIIVWDFDGTLANTGQDVWTSVEYAAAKLGGAIRKAFREDDANLGKPMQEILSNIEPFPGEGRLEAFEELVRIHYRTISEYEKTDLYPGMKELLKILRKDGTLHYIITLKPREALERILEKKGWKQYFDGWLSPDSFPGHLYTKGQLLFHFLETAGKGKEIVYVGDTASDVTACRENAIACIGVTYGDGNTATLCAADPACIVETVEELGKRLKEGI